jgi:tRNA(Met) C34 N-acetyltransferase TmcA
LGWCEFWANAELVDFWLKKLLKIHFMGFREARMNLDVDLEAKLIARCLQARSWGHVARAFKTQPASLKAEVGSSVAKILDFYGI